MAQHFTRNLSRSAIVILALSSTLRAAVTPKLNVIKTPGGGIQPQVVVDRAGTLHLVYFKGDPAAGDIFYVRRRPGEKTFSQPIRVNSQPGSAIAIGSVRGAQLALGRNGRVHVVWDGSGKALPRGPDNSSPMLYARLNRAGTSFEPQRNLMQFTRQLDGGGSVAADSAGHVYVVWHAAAEISGEVNRRVWIAESNDDGKSFARERPAYDQPTGACGCCGLRAFADSRRDVFILYRQAAEAVHRDMILLASNDLGQTFAGQDVHPWKLNACPMSTAFITQSGRDVLAAWETNGQVYFAHVNPMSFKVSTPVAAPGAANDRKHPVAASNSRGETILVWTEGTAWQRGGSLAWQVFDRHDQPLGEMGAAPGVPVWGLVAVYPNRSGGFTVIE